MNRRSYVILFYVAALVSCKQEFLEEKSSSNILTPSTLTDLNALLENQNVMNFTSALPQISADEYTIISDQNYNALPSATERNAYIWAKDLFEGEINEDWNRAYAQIFYANSVLKVLDEKDFRDTKESNFTRGWAHFVRAYIYYDLVKNFSPVYNAQTAGTDLGVPIRLNADVDEVVQRSSVQSTFNQIFKDLNIAGDLLAHGVPPLNKNRPSKAAVMALKARIYLYMGDYQNAELSVDSSLLYHNKITNYNTISTTSATPFTYNVDEVIYQSNQVSSYSALTAYSNTPAIEVNPNLIVLYKADDLRKIIFFSLNSLARYNVKRGYVGGGVYPFTGLATDEIILIKAECLARRNEPSLSSDFLNKLLINRFKTNHFVPITANNAQEALLSVLEERRKELVWRSLRWSDLKRFNREGMQIILNRKVGNTTYYLSPNDPKYVFPIPDSEINLSGIIQNDR